MHHIFIILGGIGFPVGRASCNRVKNLARSLSQTGMDVDIIMTRPSERPNNPLNLEVNGKYESVRFFYASGKTIIHENFFLRNYYKLKGLFLTLHLIYKRKKIKKLDYVILYVRHTITLFFLANFCRLLSVKVVLELCEWPVEWNHTSWKESIFFRNFCKYAFHWVDGVIVISKFLKGKVSAFEALKSVKRPAMVLPILVNSFEFQNMEWNGRQEKYFTYCGTLDYTEIIEFILEAFKLTLDKDSDHKLKIVGNAGKQTNYNRLVKKVKSLKLEKNVDFTGYVDDAELKKIYCHSLALLAPLPSGIRSEARFPTKIGEYLASGTPVITTEIGEISQYLKHRKSALLAKPDSPKDFALNMKYILHDQELAASIGAQGKAVAQKNFDACNYGERISSFLQSI